MPDHPITFHHLQDDVVSSSDSDADNDDDDAEPVNDVVLSPIPSSLHPPPPLPPPPPSTSNSTVPPPERKPIDDSRRLFQRLWTDEDEIELLQGFLDYTVSRGAGHHHDTAAFYDQIKDKLQLEFNKNQLVEKLRRLKKKYRNVLGKMNSDSGKEFVFKSAHDHATFDISRKIWCNLSGNSRGSGSGSASGSGSGGGALAVVEFDNDDQNPNPNPNYNSVTIAAATPPRPLNSSYVISHINLNSASPGGGGLSKSSTRKRPRVADKAEEKIVKIEGGIINNSSNNNSNNAGINTNVMNDYNNNKVALNNQLNNVSVSSPLQGMVEETVRNCLSPVLKGLINSATIGTTIASPSKGDSPGFKGVGASALNTVPMNFCGVKVGMDEKWRKQQILELEVYSKRLELVQDQIKSSLEELRSMES